MGDGKSPPGSPKENADNDLDANPLSKDDSSLETIVRKFQDSLSLKRHKFWETQPVGQFKDVGDTSVPEGPIEPPAQLSEVKQEPYNLPSPYEWTTCDMDSEETCTEVYNLLKNNYVEDDESMFRFNYSKEFLRWALHPPGYYRSWHIGVRAKASKKLVAFITGVPARIRVRDVVVRMSEINFLCVHKKLRSKRLAPVMIKEVTRRVHLENIWQAAYTAGVVLPTPEQKDTFLPMELGIPSKQPTNYFCKTLTASDTSTHGGFSVPRRAAEKVFPPLDFSQQPPAQELIAKDLHDVEWKFRHIFRGQPKRHLLTTGWSVFVSAKRLVAGDSVLFIWNEKNQLLLGIRRAIRPQTVMPSSVLSSDSMHIGLLAAAAHAAATNSCFTVFYNPRACPSEFVVPLSKYGKAIYHTRVSVGMRFRMLFETEESSVRRYMGTITGISDLDPVRWPSSNWRSVKVGWDESTAGERQPRVSLWEIEPLTTFPMYPSLFPLRLKRPWHPGVSSLLDNRDEGANGLMWVRGGTGEHGLHSLNFQGMGLFPWMQQRMDPTLIGNDHNQQYQAMLAAGMQNLGSGDLLRQQIMQFQQPFQYIQQRESHTSLLQQQQQQQQQAINQAVPHNILQAQTQVLTQNMPQHLIQQPLNNQQEEQARQQQQQHAYQNMLHSRSDQLHQGLQSNVPSFAKADFMDPSTKFSGSISPRQNMVSSFCPEGGGNFLNFSRVGQSMLAEPLPQQSWASKYTHSQVNAFANSMSHSTYPGKDVTEEPENCNSDSQNPTLFGVTIDSSGLLLPATVPTFATSVDADVSSMPLGDSGFQNSLYGSVQDSELLRSAGQVDPPTQSRTFVKVYKSGSVGRSLDISRFSSYNELREELAQMFGIEGKLEDPRRSGWQLVFVDRENDVLLLGDDPWEAFVNNVWYIKILSPEDVHKMGEQAVESFSPHAAQRLNSSGGEAQDLVSGLPSLGMLEY